MVPRVGNETLRPLGFGPCFGRKLQTKKRMMYSPGGPYIMVAPVVTPWAVAGQRLVFLHMYLQTQVTLKAFPIATPRGRVVSFPREPGNHGYIRNLRRFLQSFFFSQFLSPMEFWFLATVTFGFLIWERLTDCTDTIRRELHWMMT